MKISLKAARINAGLLQSDVARELGVYIKTVSNWETGKSRPRPDMIERICRLYGRKFEEIEWGFKA